MHPHGKSLAYYILFRHLPQTQAVTAVVPVVPIIKVMPGLDQYGKIVGRARFIGLYQVPGIPRVSRPSRYREAPSGTASISSGISLPFTYSRLLR